MNPSRRSILAGGSVAALCGVSAAQAASLTNAPPIPWVPTVGQLRESAGSDKAALYAMGYAEPGDGGGGLFFWKRSGAIDLGMTFPAGNDHGVWCRHLEGGALPSPIHFGAKANGKTDDTAALQRLFDLAKTRPRFRAIQLDPGATYAASGLVVPDVNGLTLFGNGATLQALAGQPADFVLATEKWARNTPEAGQPITVRDLRIDGNDVAGVGLVIQCWSSVLTEIQITKCKDAGLRLTSVTRDGTPFKTSTLVNIAVNGGRFYKNGGYGIDVADPAHNKVTDCIITNANIYGNDIGLNMDTIAGSLISGVHFYSNKTSDMLVKWSWTGGRVTNCYFESETSLSVRGGQRPFIFTNNSIRGRVEVMFENGRRPFLSMGNVYEKAEGPITTADPGKSASLSSHGDVFLGGATTASGMKGTVRLRSYVAANGELTHVTND